MPKANDKNGGTTDPIVQIHRRQLGYAFGGPDVSWCEPSNKAGMKLPVKPGSSSDENVEQREFTGCLKYSECELIDDDIRWRPWEELTDSQRETLKRLRCYRATSKWWDPKTKTLDSQRRAGWDPNVLESRRTTREKAQWIGNPFGVRTPELGTLARNIRSTGGDTAEHRDLSPCPIGGCVTPEMQRDYAWEKRTALTEWANMQACPFFYRHIDSELSTATPNPQRFTQCYVTLKPVRDLLAKSEIVAVAPIFRASQSTRTIGDAFWYPFYSGFSFLQLPTWSPEHATGWSDPTMQLRWQATTTVRQQTARVFRTLPIQQLFEGVEKGDLLVKWETQVRILSVSDGQASALLLQWLLMSRLEAVCTHSLERAVDIAGELEWLYEKPGSETNDKGVCGALNELGYDLEQAFGIKLKQNGAFRFSTLEDDLVMLGLVDERGYPTQRLRATVLWLTAICSRATRDALWNRNRPNDLGSKVLRWLGEEATETVRNFLKPGHCDRRSLYVVCWLLIRAAAAETIGLPDVKDVAKDGLRKIAIENRDAALTRLRNYKEDKFNSICRLVPPVHVLVRANWQTPVRWIFMPIGEASQVSEDEGGNLRARINSGLIILLKDDFNSSPYRPNMTEPVLNESQDRVLRRLWSLRHLLSAVARIEESHVRDDLISTKEWWDFHRTFSVALQHNMSKMKVLVSGNNDPSAELVSYLLTNLEGLFFVPPEGGTRARMDVSVDAHDVIQRTVAAMARYLAAFGDKIPSVNLIAPSQEVYVRIRPQFAFYRGETAATIRDRARAEFEVFLFNLLLERAAKHSAVNLFLIGNGASTVIEIRVPAVFDREKIWDSKVQTLDYWPRRRGFYLTFAWATSLGSIRQQLFNSGDEGIIRLEFATDL